MEGHLVSAGSIAFESLILRPLLLVLFFERDQGVSLLSLVIVRIKIPSYGKQAGPAPLSSLVLEIFRASMALGTESVEAIVADGQDL